MGRFGWVLPCLILASAPVSAAEKRDALAEARLLYNQKRFDAALAAAERARTAPTQADSADLIAARSYLERFRETAAPDDLANARERLRRLNPGRFDARERGEYILGLGEALFLEESYGAAADVFESVLASRDGLAADARERVLDWWAGAVDREARPRPDIERQSIYQRVRVRMRDEVAARPSSGTAAYWLAAAARAQGDVDAAWAAVTAGWVRAPLMSDRGAALRSDLDQLMLTAIVPERARTLAQPSEALRQQWEEFKQRWSRD